MRRGHRLAVARATAMAGLALTLGACSWTGPIASLQLDPETTGSISRSGAASAAFPLDGEDWRRARSALSLAVDPQGPGLPVNWDNPASKRRGSFVQAGNVALAEKTVCRPFLATIASDAATPAKFTGEACRLGPGEWTVQSFPREGEAGPARAASGRENAQPLPPRSAPMLLTAARRE
jgi:surface antigen